MKLKLLYLKDEIANMYTNGINIPNIAKHFNCYPQAVENVLKHLNLYKSYRPDQGNTRYFENINSEIKAYFVGFIAADGCVQSNGKNSYGLTITLHEKDRIVLDKLREEIGSEKPLMLIPSKNHIRFTLFNKDLYNDLNNLGIIPKKSLIIGDVIKNIPEEYRHSFVLGYFDGDGSVVLPKHPKKPNINTKRICIFIRGTEALLSGIAQELNLEQYMLKSYDSTYTLRFSKKSEIIKFFNLYTKNKFFLYRKYEKFLQRIN